MKTYTTTTGIELLLPVVPKDAEDFEIKTDKNGLQGFKYACSKHVKTFWTGYPNLSILGTCWRERDKLVCEGFDPALMVDSPEFRQIGGGQYYKDYYDPIMQVKNPFHYPLSSQSFDSWLRREGIEIPQGMKLVIVKKN